MQPKKRSSSVEFEDLKEERKMTVLTVSLYSEQLLLSLQDQTLVIQPVILTRPVKGIFSDTGNSHCCSLDDNLNGTEGNLIPATSPLKISSASNSSLPYLTTSSNRGFASFRVSPVHLNLIHQELIYLYFATPPRWSYR